MEAAPPISFRRHSRFVSFPDPDPDPNIPTCVDDMGRFSAAHVRRIVSPRNEKDVQRCMKWAYENGCHISIRCAQHSMGAQTLREGGLILDCYRMRHLAYDVDTHLVTVGPGLLWGEVMQYLDQFGRAPFTMQSYCTFGVGGTLSVNAHGITSNSCAASSVVSLRVVTADGKVRIISPSLSEDGELFSHVLGGYGLFGVIVSATLKTQPNHNLVAESMTVPLQEFSSLFEELWCSGAYGAVISRVDPSSVASCSNDSDVAHLTAFVLAWRKASGAAAGLPNVEHGVCSPLAPSTRTLGGKMSWLYTWIAPALQEFRSTAEALFGSVDLPDTPTTTNGLVFEDATPFAKTEGVVTFVDDTYLLQEFFVPRTGRHLVKFFQQSRHIFEDIVHKPEEKCVTLLNITIRAVDADSTTALPYSRAGAVQAPDDGKESFVNGVYSFVLYYRLARSSEAEQILRDYHMRLGHVATSLGGTFYLPYRIHYDAHMLFKAYPEIVAFLEKKMQYDPSGLFRSEWLDGILSILGSRAPNGLSSRAIDFCNNIPAPLTGIPDMTRADPREASAALVTIRGKREGFYRELFGIGSPHNRRESFFKVFLHEIFCIENATTVCSAINRAVWNPRNISDMDIYASIVRNLEPSVSPLGAAGKGIRSIMQLRSQREEFLKETLTMLRNVGVIGSVRDIVSIGDHGKLVRRLQAALQCEDGKVWIVHDGDGEGLVGVLERESLLPVGSLVPIDYLCTDADWAPLRDIGDESADLVTLNIGLHHLPPKQIVAFLHEVSRVLRSGGIFIVREHDATEEVMPVLYAAHSVFNAVTGVSYEDERDEIRAFRTIDEWVCIIESCGLKDAMTATMQVGDPTWDWMLCFYKAPFGDLLTRSLREHAGANSCRDVSSKSCEGIGIALDREYKKPDGDSSGVQSSRLLPQKESNLVLIIQSWIDFILLGLSEIEDGVLSSAASLPIGTRELFESICVSPFLKSAILPIRNVMTRLRSVVSRAEKKVPAIGTLPHHSGGFFDVFVPREFILALPVVRRRVSEGKATAVEVLLSVLADMFTNHVFSTSAAGACDVPPLSPAASHSSSLNDAAQTAPPIIDEVENTLRTVLLEVPDLSLPDALSRLQLGFVARLALPSVVGSSVTDLARRLTPIHSRDSWDRLCGALRIATRSGFPPPIHTWDRTCDLNSPPQCWSDVEKIFQFQPWSLAAAAALAAPGAVMTPAGARQLAAAGLTSIVNLFNWTSRLRKSSASSMFPVEKSGAWNNDTLNRYVHSLWRPRTVTMVGSQIINISEVHRVIRARYGYESLTAEYLDVTDHVAGVLTPDGVLELEQIDFVRLRQENLTSELLDMGRLLLIGKKLELIIEYIPLPSIFEESVSTEKFVQQIVSTPSLGCEDVAPYKHSCEWWKLPEWYQVEMVSVFAKSLSSVPWYRFPFMGMIGNYGTVVYRTASRVASRRGLLNALSDSGFLTSAVPGVVMGALFMQLAFFATPLKRLLGDSYDEVTNIETLVILCHDWPTFITDWKSVHPELSVHAKVPLSADNKSSSCSASSSDITSPGGLVVLRIPPFNAFSDTLIRIARKLPSAQLITASGRTRLMVRIDVNISCAAQSQFSGHTEVQFSTEAVITKYRNAFERPPLSFVAVEFVPPAGTEGLQEDILAGFTVSVLACRLFPFLRQWRRANDPHAHIVRIYDFR